MAPSVGRPPSMRCPGAGAWVTPSVQARHAYLGRTVTMTRSCAGTMSSRWMRSSPILCIIPQPHGHIRVSGSTTCPMRVRFSGRLPRWRCPVLLFLGLGDGNGEILDGQLLVVLVELFGLLAMHHMVQLRHEMLKAFVDLLKRGHTCSCRLQSLECRAVIRRQNGKVEVFGSSGSHAATIP